MKYHNKGFSLIELIVAFGILIFIGGMAIYIYMTGSKIENDERIRSDLLLSANTTIDKMSKDIRTANEVISSSTDSIELWLDNNDDQKKEPEEIKKYFWVWDGKHSGDIYMEYPQLNQKNVLCKNVTVLKFTCPPSGTAGPVSIDMILVSGKINLPLQSKVWQRNI